MTQKTEIEEQDSVDNILIVKDLYKYFGGVKAIDGFI